MSRSKRAVAQGWKATDEQRNKDNEPVKKEEKPIDEEEHKKRVELLNNLGLLKNESKNSIPEWKLKICVNCDKEYLKGTGITKIEFYDKNKIIDYDDFKYIGFEGIEELEGESYSILCFCSNECCEKYFKENSV